MRAVLVLFAVAGMSFATCTSPCVASTVQGGTANSVTTSAIDTTGSKLLVVITTQFGAVLGTLTDSATGCASPCNTWTKLTTQDIAGTSSSAIYYAANPTVGANHVFVISGSAIYPGIAVAGFSGVKTSSPRDQENGAVGVAATSRTTGAVVPTENGELLVTGLGDTTGASSITINSGFTITGTVAYNAGSSFGQSLAYFVQGTAASINPTWSWSASNTVAATIATFKMVASSGGYTLVIQ